MTQGTPSKAIGQSRFTFERLRSEILSGQRLPEARLNIAVLAQELKVTPGAVREALAALEAESLAASEPSRGYRVSPVSLVDLRDLVQARIEIEKLCIAESIRHGDLTWESKVVAAMHRLTRVPHHDPKMHDRLNRDWADAHAEFHRALVGGCANRWLLRMREILYRQSERYRQFAATQITTERDTESEHKALEIAVLNRNVSAAQEAMTAHLAKTAEMLLQSPRLSHALVAQMNDAGSGL
jgi:GntR family carbon starvation induced transcriptional regulator